MEWRLRCVVPAAAVTTRAKPHAQQQLARDLEVNRTAMGQRCRLQSFGAVQRRNPQKRRQVTFLKNFSLCWKVRGHTCFECHTTTTYSPVNTCSSFIVYPFPFAGLRSDLCIYLHLYTTFKLYLNTTTTDSPVDTCSPVFACCIYE